MTRAKATVLRTYCAIYVDRAQTEQPDLVLNTSHKLYCGVMVSCIKEPEYCRNDTERC